jgi:hypothetical protein
MFKFAMSVFGLLDLSLFLIGCIYLSLNEFMPYHAEALQVSWADLNPNYRGLILGLIKGLGGGAFVAGVAILFMVGVSVRKSPQPFLVLLPIVAIGYSTFLCYATFTVYTSTPGNPPLLLTVLNIPAGVVASIALILSQRHKSGAHSIGQD